MAPLEVSFQSRDIAQKAIGLISRNCQLKPNSVRTKPMPTGPKGEMRPADVIGNAVKVMRIATGEEPEDFGPATEKNKAAQELGRAGGKKSCDISAQGNRSQCG